MDTPMGRVKPFFQRFTRAAGYLAAVPAASAALALGMVLSKRRRTKDEGGLKEGKDVP